MLVTVYLPDCGSSYWYDCRQNPSVKELIINALKGRGGRMFPARFTERARQLINYAHEEAIKLNHSQVDTEHLLLGLIREEDGEYLTCRPYPEGVINFSSSCAV